MTQAVTDEELLYVEGSGQAASDLGVRKFVAAMLEEALEVGANEKVPLSVRGHALAWLASSAATPWWDISGIEQSRALAAWGWTAHAREALERDELEAGAAGRARRNGRTHVHGRPRLAPNDAELLRRGIEYMSIITREGAGMGITRRSLPSPTLEMEEEMTETATTQAVRDAIREEVERDSQATSAELYERVKSRHDVELPGKSSFTGYHVPAVREEMGWAWDPGAQAYVQEDGEGSIDPDNSSSPDVDLGSASSSEPEADPDEARPAEVTDELASETADPHQTPDPVAVSEDPPPDHGLGYDPRFADGVSISVTDGRGTHLTALKNADGLWRVDFSMDVPEDVVEDLRDLVMDEVFAEAAG